RGALKRYSLRLLALFSPYVASLTGAGWWRLPSSGGVSLLESDVLRSASLVEDQAAGKAGARSDGGSEPGIPADRAGHGANASASNGAGERALLGYASCW